MNLMNMLAILLVLAIAGFIVARILVARKNQEVEEDVEKVVHMAMLMIKNMLRN